MKESIVLFDGVCNFCNASVMFVIKRDTKNQFKFASLQSDYAKQLFRELNIDSASFDSIVLVENGAVNIKSTAALKIARNLGGLWPLLYWFIIVPKFIRDFFYDFFARNRYKWFGRTDQCAVPTPELRSKFLG